MHWKKSSWVEEYNHDTHHVILSHSGRSVVVASLTDKWIVFKTGRSGSFPHFLAITVSLLWIIRILWLASRAKFSCGNEISAKYIINKRLILFLSQPLRIKKSKTEVEEGSNNQNVCLLIFTHRLANNYKLCHSYSQGWHWLVEGVESLHQN